MAEETKRAAIIGVVTASDRASAGVYEDQSGPAIVAYLTNSDDPFPYRAKNHSGRVRIRARYADRSRRQGALRSDPDHRRHRAVAARPDARRRREAAAPRDLPGFGELMRQESLKQVPTAILSRQIAAHRGPCLVINLPGKPASIETCLNAVFPAVPYCLDLIGAASIETDAAILKSFRPKQQ